MFVAPADSCPLIGIFGVSSNFCQVRGTVAIAESSSTRGQSEDLRKGSGYALLLLMMIVTTLLIGLTVVIPEFLIQDRREQEEELIFRGNQYARAVYLFHNRFGRYPSSVKELTETNNLHFLRKEFKDPMAKDGEWRFIHISPTGVLTDSKYKIFPGSNPVAPSPLAVNSPQQAALGSAGTDAGSYQPAQWQLIPSQYAPVELGLAQLWPSSSAQRTATGQSQSDQSEADPSQAKADDDSDSAAANDDSGDQASQLGNDAAGSSSDSGLGRGQVFGSFIAGVASTSHQTSIRIWHHKRHYDQWEFVGVVASAWAMPLMQMPALPGGAPGAPSPFGSTQAVQPEQPGTGQNGIGTVPGEQF